MTDSANNGEKKKRGRVKGERMQLIELEGVVRRFNKQNLVLFYLAACAAKNLDEERQAFFKLGKPVDVLPEPVCVDEWEVNDFLSQIAELQK